MKEFLEWFFRETKAIMPKKLYALLSPHYHLALAFLSALIYRFPSKNIFVIGVTGTKGKTSTVEILSAILEEAGHKTALSSTLRFKEGDISRRNLHKMTMPGRFVLQKFLRQAVKSGCKYAIMEMTSEGVKQHRHKFIFINTLIFTNLSREHIESHGSYKKYLEAKLEIKKALEMSPKKEKYIVVNRDDKEADKFLESKVENKIIFGISDAQPYKLEEGGSVFTLGGLTVKTRLRGEFNIYNMLAATAFAKTQNIHKEIIKKALEKLPGIPGRMEGVFIKDKKGNDFSDFGIIVDYAHTPDSLEKVYQELEPSPKICVLGGTGGGRDSWKRSEMGGLAAQYCKKIILTDEDPYDENPFEIMNDIKVGIDKRIRELEKENKPVPEVNINADRHDAIKEAIYSAKKEDVIIITGKGTDPYIMGPRGTKTPWDDAGIVKEILSEYIK